VAFHGREQKDQAQFLRQVRERAIQMRLKLIRNSNVFRGGGARLVLRLRPKRVSQFAAFPGAQTVEREAKRDANEPAAEAVPIAQAIELAIGAQQRFLCHIFGVSGVTQNSPSHAVGEGAALGEAFLKLAPCVSLGCFGRQLILLVNRDRQAVFVMGNRKAVIVMRNRKTVDRATWLDQNQLLHKFSTASARRSTSRASLERPPHRTSD
jgi:hypothetical protein